MGQDLMQNQDRRRKEPCRVPAGLEKNWKSNDEERRSLKAFETDQWEGWRQWLLRSSVGTGQAEVLKLKEALRP